MAPHTSGIGLTEFIGDVIDLRGYNIFSPNIAVGEAQETEALAGQAAEDNASQSQLNEDQLLLDEQLNGEV